MDDQLRQLLDLIFESHLPESGDGCVDCEMCMEQLHTLWGMVESGAELHELLPAIAEHFDLCPSCNEEYQAFLCIMRAEQEGLTANCLPSQASAAATTTTTEDSQSHA